MSINNKLAVCFTLQLWVSYTFGGMKYEYYDDVKFDVSYSTFDFVSEGNKGSILKRVLFTPTALPTIYNLAFGNMFEIYGDINGEWDLVPFQKGLNVKAF